MATLIFAAFLVFCIALVVLILGASNHGNRSQSATPGMIGPIAAPISKIRPLETPTRIIMATPMAEGTLAIMGAATAEAVTMEVVTVEDIEGLFWTVRMHSENNLN